MIRSFRNTWTPGVGGRYPKPWIFEAFNYRYHEYVVGQFHASEARDRIITAPARTSKSFAAAYDALPEVFPDYEFWKGRYYPKQIRVNDKRRIYSVGPNFAVNKEFDYLYRELVVNASPALQKTLGFGLDKGCSNQPKQGNMEINLDFGKDKHGKPVKTVIKGMTGANAEALQSEEVDLVLLSEAAEHDERILSRYLETRYGKLVAPTTPKPKAEWLKKMIEMGEEDPTLGIDHFRFTPYCNPDFDWSRFWSAHKKAESRVCGRIITEPPPNVSQAQAMPTGHDCFDSNCPCIARKDARFAEQFLGLWSFDEGRALPFRWNSNFGFSHVLDSAPSWFSGARKFVSMDWGFSDGCCALWWAVDQDGTCIIYRELYEAGLDSRAFIDKIHEVTNKHNNERIQYFVSDPQKPELTDYLRRKGLPLLSGRHVKDQRNRELGGQMIVDMLSTDPMIGRPMLFVLSEKAGHGLGAPSTIHEWKLLRRKEGFRGNEWATGALIGKDHAFDAARYFVTTRPGAPRPETYFVEDEFKRIMDLKRKESRRRRLSPGLVGRNPSVYA